MEKVAERFLRYVSFDTASDENSEDFPTTPGQMVLARHIAQELKEIGLEEVRLDQNGYVMAKLSSNMDRPCEGVGFIAHMDTSPDMSGRDVKPRIVKNYDGKDIVLNEQVTLKTEDFPEIKNYIGNDIIVTDGNTLLGADDKAGIAEIVTAMEYLCQNPHIRHPEIRICFTPDEEVGKGADRFDVGSFGVKYAYTVDGGEIGEFEYENFNAAYAGISIKGRNVHPGTALDKMVNSVKLGIELNEMLPKEQAPEYTEDYQGFFHLTDFNGDVELTKMDYIIRDFDKAEFENKKELLRTFTKQMSEKYPKADFHLEIKDQYYNMKEKVEPVMFLVDKAIAAIEKAGIKPIVRPIRGGTDGARLSFMGLPCPNIFTGGHNFHGRYEYIPVNSMIKSTEVILNIIDEFTK